MTSCLIVQPVHEAGLEVLRQNGIRPVICPAPDMETVARLIPGCEAVITRDAGLSRAAFLAADRLRVVVVHGAGHDRVDKAAASETGVLVVTTPGANAQSVAELGLGLALAVARRIPAADRAVRAGAAGFREAAPFAELAGKTALIVGWGAIGQRLGRMLDLALGMTVLVYSPRVPETGPYRRVASLMEGLAQADLVSLHTPMRPETRGMMGAAQFAALRPGAILLNLAREGLVDEAALLEALEGGRLAGAGLDVYSEAAPQGPLAALDRVILTPHLGGTTEEALRRVAEGSAARVVAALAGQVPASAINPEVWSQSA